MSPELTAEMCCGCLVSSASSGIGATLVTILVARSKLNSSMEESKKVKELVQVALTKLREQVRFPSLSLSRSLLSPSSLPLSFRSRLLSLSFLSLFDRSEFTTSTQSKPPNPSSLQPTCVISSSKTSHPPFASDSGRRSELSSRETRTSTRGRRRFEERFTRFGSGRVFRSLDLVPTRRSRFFASFSSFLPPPYL